MGRGKASKSERLGKGQKALRRADCNALDLRFRKATPPHQRQDVLKNVAVAVATKAREARPITDVVTDHDLIQMSTIDETADPAQPLGIVGQVDVERCSTRARPLVSR